MKTSVEQKAKSRAPSVLGAWRRNDRHRTQTRRKLRKLGPRGLGDDEAARRRDGIEEPAYAFALQRRLDDDQSLGSAVSLAVDRDDVLAFQHAASRLATVARRRDQPGGLLETGVVAGADARHRFEPLSAKVSGVVAFAVAFAV